MTTSSPSSWLKERIVAAEEDLTASHNRHEVTGYPLASRVEFGTIDEPSEQRLGVGCSALFDLAQSSDTDDIVGPGSAWSNLPDHERREIIRVLVDQVTIARSEDRHDIVGRTTIEFATESNVIDLANRPERIRGKHLNLKVKTA